MCGCGKMRSMSLKNVNNSDSSPEEKKNEVSPTAIWLLGRLKVHGEDFSARLCENHCTAAEGRALCCV